MFLSFGFLSAEFISYQAAQSSPLFAHDHLSNRSIRAIGRRNASARTTSNRYTIVRYPLSSPSAGTRFDCDRAILERPTCLFVAKVNVRAIALITNFHISHVLREKQSAIYFSKFFCVTKPELLSYILYFPERFIAKCFTFVQFCIIKHGYGSD